MATATQRRKSSKPRSGHKTHRGESAGPRSMWSGSISFGLVNIPVRLSPAVREQRVAFHLLHDQDKARLRRKLVCPADGREVHPEHIVRGYEIGKDQYVTVRDEELEACAPEKTRAIEITDFVDLDQIDPIYFDRPYYLLPQPGAAKSYRLLAEALDRTKKVGVARFVLHDKEHLCALRTKGRLICLETMYFGDEIVDPSEFAPRGGHAGEREMKVARQLIESLTQPFDPGRYRDQWRDCVRKVLQKKAEGDEVVTPEAEAPAEKPKTARAVDLMAALEASLAKARSAAGAGGGERASNGSNGNGRANGHAHSNGHPARSRAAACDASTRRSARAARPAARRRARS